MKNRTDPEHIKAAIKAFYRKTGRLPKRSGPYKEKSLNQWLSRFCSEQGKITDRSFSAWARSKGYGLDTVSENIAAIWSWSKRNKRRPSVSKRATNEERRLAILLSSYVNEKKSTYRKSFAIAYNAKYSRGKHFLDLAGKTFGRLTPIKIIGSTPKGGYIWECVCECGQTTTAPGSKIKSGERKSCGCIGKENLRPGNNRLNMEGVKTDYLTVIGPAHTSEKRNGSFWRCRCKCGNITILLANQIKSGAVKSCGCKRSENQYKSIENDAYRAQKAGAASRNYTWHLSKEEYLAIARRPCVYCGAISVRRNKSTGASLNLNSVDRRNNEPFYRKGNCQSVCFRCQEIKSDKSHHEFTKSIAEIAKYYRKPR